MVIKLGHQNVGHQRGRGHAAGDGAARCRDLHHLVTATTGFFDPRDLDHFELGDDHVQHLADVFTNPAQLAATIGASRARVELATFARRIG